MRDAIQDITQKLDHILYRVESLVTATLTVRENGSNLNAEGDLLSIAHDFLNEGHEFISKMENEVQKLKPKPEPQAATQH